MNEFKFQLNQQVQLSPSREAGVIISRLESINRENTYLVRYVAADGRLMEQWWDESAVEDAQ